MNYQSIKKKLLRFKSIFTANWPAFMASHPRYDTDYYQAEIAKMLNCGSETNGFAVYQCLGPEFGIRKCKKSHSLVA